MLISASTQLNGLQVTLPHSGSLLHWNLEMLVFEDREKPEYPEKKPLGAKERTN